jgi:tRNA-Thr(GGU) m(6)t(6)A37 methyltransferase TsaA
MGRDDIRAGELRVGLPAGTDAGVYFIGRIRTPWADRAACPHRGRADGPACRIELFAPWDRGLDGIAACASLEVLYWLHESRRDLVLQSPRRDGRAHGVFSLRSPVRPNPIGTSIIELLAVEGAALVVRGLDCLDGTPLLDIKPHRRTSG